MKDTFSGPNDSEANDYVDTSTIENSPVQIVKEFIIKSEYSSPVHLLIVQNSGDKAVDISSFMSIWILKA